MGIQFSDSSGNTGIVEQTLSFMGVDSTQWPTFNILNSTNNWLDNVASYAIASDRRFQWDDTNHSKLPIGKTNLVLNQSDYSFLTDAQGNRILTLTGIDIKDANGNYTKLEELDENEETRALDTIVVSGTPTGYYKIADNIIRLNRLPTANITFGLQFHFQRTPSYFVISDTTKQPGVADVLHRGFVIASAYDGALTLGLPSLQPLSVELQKETAKMINYFSIRNEDVKKRMSPARENNH